MWLDSLKLENFKLFKSLDFPLTRFNILIGPNSTGKSSILQSLWILKNTLKNKPYSGIALRTNAYDYGNYEDIVTGKDKTEEVKIGITGKKLLDHPLSEDGFQDLASFGYYLSFTHEGPTEVYFGVSIEPYKITFNSRRNKETKSNFSGKPVQSNLTHSLDGVHPRIQLDGNDPISKNFNRIFANGDFTTDLLKDLYYIPFHRTMTKYGAMLTQLPVDILESRPEDLASANLNNLSKNTVLLDRVSQFMSELMGKSVRPRNLDLPTQGGAQGVTFDFVKKGFSNAIANEGTGPNQAILLLSILLGTPKRSIIIIDEPEIHLHPKAQSKLAKIIMQIAKDDEKQIIFATHSEHMLYPFLAAVSSKTVRPEQVSISYIEQNENGMPKIEKLSVNEHGQINGGLKGFWDADLEALSDFVGEKNE